MTPSSVDWIGYIRTQSGWLSRPQDRSNLDRAGRRRNVCKGHGRTTGESPHSRSRAWSTTSTRRCVSGSCPATCRGARSCGRRRWPRSWASRAPRSARRFAGCRPRAWSTSHRTAAPPSRSCDFGDMRHAWSARVALEPGAARLAAERRDADSIAAMRDAVAEQRAVGSDRDAGASPPTAASTCPWPPRPAIRTSTGSPRCSGCPGSACPSTRPRLSSRAGQGVGRRARTDHRCDRSRRGRGGRAPHPRPHSCPSPSGA